MNQVPIGFKDWFVILMAVGLLIIGLLNKYGIIDLSDHKLPKEEIHTVSPKEYNPMDPCVSPSSALKGAGDYESPYLLRKRI